MSGNSVVIDSNIIILASRRQVDINDLLARYDHFYVSIITYMEVLGFKNITSDERLIIDAFFDEVEVIDTGKEIANMVIDLKTSSTRKIKLPDAIILATAKLLKADLFTLNVSDFEHIDEHVKIITN